jgi:glycosyltransferase involved in cell wall biosynthesis
MHVLIVNNSKIPVTLYGGTERVIWYLGKELVRLGHQVSYLVAAGSTCDFATVIPIDPIKKLVDQVPAQVDLVHFNETPPALDTLSKPYLITIHGNSNDDRIFAQNTVFVSNNHASRYGSNAYVHNGLDWTDYEAPDFSTQRTFFHFLGNAAWRVKNVKGAINAITQTRHEKLSVLGGVRFNVKMGLRFTLSPRIRFYGMVGGAQKYRLLNQSKGLVFPVRWHEPFGLSVIESLFYGCPVFGTPYGALPEIVTPEVGFLSNRAADLTEQLELSSRFDPKTCHAHAVSQFNSKKMALSYQTYYQKVLDGAQINEKPPQLLEIQKDKFLPWIS